MNITHIPIYCVRDPGPNSELADICWQTTVSRLPRYAIGTGFALWESEHTAVYDDEAEARADARARL